MLASGRKIGVLWDMDGVIVDSGRAHFVSWQKSLARYGLPCTWEFFQQTFGMNNRGIISLLMERDATDEEVETIGGLKEELFRQDVAGKLEPLPGVMDWLRRFTEAGFAQAVASSAPQENIDAIITGLDIGEFFTECVSGAHLRGKPDPATFLLAASRLGKAPEECLVIEDARVGVEAAKSGGMKCVAVCTTHEAAELAKADKVVKGLGDLAIQDLRELFP